MALCEEAMTGGFREREAWDDETTALLSRARRLARGGVRGEKAEEGKEKDDDDDGDDDDDDGDDDAARPAREDENARRRSVSNLLRPQNIPPSAALVLLGVLVGVLLGVGVSRPSPASKPSLRALFGDVAANDRASCPSLPPLTISLCQREEREMRVLESVARTSTRRLDECAGR